MCRDVGLKNDRFLKFGCVWCRFALPQSAVAVDVAVSERRHTLPAIT
jgi:hypothetical protein